MARYRARVQQDAEGAWIASAVEFPNCWSRGATADAALARLRDEIRYRLEYCPCSSVRDDHVELDVGAGLDTPAAGRARRVPSDGTAAHAAAPQAPSRVVGGGRASFRGVAGCPQPGAIGRATPTAGDAEESAAAAAARRTEGWRRWDD